MKEKVIVSFLYLFDFIMNLITLGQWGRSRGEERVVFKLNKRA